jgi:hypothetical protein
VAALLRDSESYQSIAPSLMGRSYRLVLGKHSGRQAVNGVFDQMGYHLNAAQINQLLPAIRRFAENWKRSPKDYELVAIYDELCGESPCGRGGNDGVVLSNSRRGRTSLRRIFFQFFAVPYQPELLGRCSLPVLATFHRKLRAEVPLQNRLEENARALAAGATTARGELSATVSGERNMRPKFTFSEEVRVVRAIRNDGTVAGFAPARCWSGAAAPALSATGAFFAGSDYLPDPLSGNRSDHRLPRTGADPHHPAVAGRKLAIWG